MRARKQWTLISVGSEIGLTMILEGVISISLQLDGKGTVDR